MRTRSVKKIIISALLVIALIFSVGYLNTFAYTSPVECCDNPDCTAPIWGTIRTGSSIFLHVSWDQHQRSAIYDFRCDNCKNEWSNRIVTNENHEFVNRRCECGYLAY